MRGRCSTPTDSSSTLSFSVFSHSARAAQFGANYDLVMLLFGQLNVFRREEARDLLARAYRALRPGGLLMLAANGAGALSFDARSRSQRAVLAH